MKKGTGRKVKFFLIQTFLLPAVIVLMKLLSRTWRIDPASADEVATMIDAEKALMVVCHGCFPTVIPYSHLARNRGRRLALMTSPSRDGHVLDTVVNKFGIDVVKGSSASRAVTGSRALIGAIREGKIGILAIDGPRGPRGVPKPGYLSLCSTTGARLFVVTATASSSLKFKSWDRMFIPLPFARIRIRVTEHQPRLDANESDTDALGRLHRRILDDARELESPFAIGLDDIAPASGEASR